MTHDSSGLIRRRAHRSRPRLGASVWLLLFICALSVHAGAQDLRRFTYSEAAMGTEFRVVLYATDATTANAAAGEAFARAAEIDSLLSDWRSDSEITRLSLSAGADRCTPASRDLISVLEHAQRIASASDGAFDVTVGPMTRLWRWAMRRAQLPPESRLSAARAAVGHEKVVVDSDRRCVRLTAPEMKLDLGGIAKGYAADEMLKTLRSKGITRSLVDAGGDIVAGDPPPGETGWTVETRALDARGRFALEDVLLTNGAVATSGDAHRFLQAEGVRYSHLLDPRTGYGLTHRRLVTVLAPTGVEADALASAISVMGRDGLHLAAGPGYGARIIEFGSPRKQSVEAGLLKD